eukprot:1420882-Rhodomonas_salina.2
MPCTSMLGARCRAKAQHLHGICLLVAFVSWRRDHVDDTAALAAAPAAAPPAALQRPPQPPRQQEEPKQNDITEQQQHSRPSLQPSTAGAGGQRARRRQRLRTRGARRARSRRRRETSQTAFHGADAGVLASVAGVSHRGRDRHLREPEPDSLLCELSVGAVPAAHGVRRAGQPHYRQVLHRVLARLRAGTATSPARALLLRLETAALGQSVRGFQCGFLQLVSQGTSRACDSCLLRGGPAALEILRRVWWVLRWRTTGGGRLRCGDSIGEQSAGWRAGRGA